MPHVKWAVVREPEFCERRDVAYMGGKRTKKKQGSGRVTTFYYPQIKPRLHSRVNRLTIQQMINPKPRTRRLNIGSGPFQLRVEV